MGAFIDTPWTGQQFSPPTPLDIATLENAIVTQLSTQITQLEVVQFPDNPKSYRLTHPVGAALVVYRGATYGEVKDDWAIVQERRLEFEITLLVRDLGWAVGGEPSGGSPGAYAILEAARGALTGFRIPGARKMYPVRERFIERDPQGGVWIYSLTVALSTVAVEASTTPSLPLFVRGVANDTGGVTTVSVAAAPFTFGSNGQIQLPNTNIVAIVVWAIGGQTYVENSDYSLDQVTGVVTLLPSGQIAAGAQVKIAWSYCDSVVASAGETSPYA